MMTGRNKQCGLVVLTGGGPGDADLITLAGVDWLKRADTVIYDRLSAERLLEICRHDTEKIYVGKQPGRPAVSQDEINAILIKKCDEGRLVVRLKGGDPLIFGRGGEEAAALAEAGMPYRIVPGVTAAAAAAAFAAIPLTDRRFASTVTLVTGHEDPAKTESNIDYDALAKLDTLVFYMGVGRLGEIAERLIRAGRSPDTLAAVVQDAATPHQRTIVAALADIAGKAEEAGIRPPALTIVGDVVSLRNELSWFEQLPLFGRTILVTRTRQQTSELSEKLRALGADVIEAPTIEIQPPDDTAKIDAALERLGDFDWLALTSPNGAEALMARLAALNMDARSLAGVKIAAIGPATAEVLWRRSIKADLIPDEFTTAAMGEALVAAGAGAGRVLLARADIAGDALGDTLRAAGAEVEEIAIYRTARPAALPQRAVEALRAGVIDWITFTSSSTVENFLSLLASAGDVNLSAVKLAAIGPVTAETLSAAGLTPTVVARPHTIAGLAEAIVSYSNNA